MASTRFSRLLGPTGFSATALTALALVALAGRRAVDAGQADEPALRFGSSTALSGPASDLGSEMSAGIQLAFAEQNGRGGVRGRAVELTVLDDGYEPERTAPNIRSLLDDAQVLGVVGNVGTPTAIAAIPMTNEAHTVFFGAFTGAGVLRKAPPEPYVINFRASYAEETATMVDGLVEHAGIAPSEIALFTQRDGFGDAGFSGAKIALARHGQEESKIVHGRYERNTLDVEGALAEILMAEVRPRAVIMVGTYRPCAKFIKMARELGLDALFLNVSFVGAVSLGTEAGDAAEGVIVTQVVPHLDSDLPIMQGYRAGLARSGAQPSYTSLEGFIVGRILCLALERHTGQLDREGVLAALQGLGRFDIGLGFELELSARSTQASHRIWPTRFQGGLIREFEWADLAPVAK